jgi:hypothetical protein
MRAKKKFTFTGTVESVSFNLTTTAVFIPHYISIDLPGRTPRIMGLINGAPFSITVQYRKEFGKYFSVSNELLSAAGVKTGDIVHVSFRIIEADTVEIPEELETVLSDDERIRRSWSSYRGKLQRAVAGYLDAARKIDIRMKKALQILQKAKAGTLQQQVTKKKRNKNA